jgi:hypothetical protein
MGIVKQHWIEQQERGWYDIDDSYVCAACFEDYALVQFVEENATECQCTYCGKESSEPIAADMNEVMAYIMEGISQEWSDPDNEGMSYITREGGWQGAVYDSWDLIFDEVGLAANSEQLLEDIVGSISDRQWCQRNLYRLLPHESLVSDWGNFSERIKYHQRFMFHRVDEAYEPEDTYDDSRPTSQILDDLGRFVNELGLFSDISPGHKIYRVRVSGDGIKYKTVQELGPPPAQQARFSNRMSPAGISMFYGATDVDTALAETVTKREGINALASVAEFETIKPFRIIDLTQLPDIPSIFDGDRRDIRPGCIFLHRFLADITKKVVKDGREHIEYVPTQVVTEYLRHVFRFDDDAQAMGVAFPSSVNEGGISWVLFMTSAPKEGEWAFSDGSVEKWLMIKSVDVIEV